MYSNSSKGHKPEMTLPCKIGIEIVMIPKNHILYLTDLTDFLIVNNSNESHPNRNYTSSSLSVPTFMTKSENSYPIVVSGWMF